MVFELKLGTLHYFCVLFNSIQVLPSSDYKTAIQRQQVSRQLTNYSETLTLNRSLNLRFLFSYKSTFASFYQRKSTHHGPDGCLST